MDRDDWDAYGPDHLAKTFIEQERAAKVTYSDDNGRKFRVIVRQKPNPIGFRAQLPGDKRK